MLLFAKLSVNADRTLLNPSRSVVEERQMLA